MSIDAGTVFGTSGGLRRNIATLYLVQAANFVLPLVSVPYLVRMLGAASYGQLALAAALIVYFTALTDFGFGTTATRAAAAAHDNPKRLGTLLAGVTLVRLGLLCVSLAILVSLMLLSDRIAGHARVYAASAVSLAGTALFPAWFLQGIEAMDRLALAVVIGRVAAVVLIFVFVHSPQDIVTAAALQALPLLIAALWVARFVLRRVPIRYWRVDLSALPALFTDSRNAFVSSSAATMYTSAITLVLGFVAPTAVVGAYSAASKIVAASASFLWAPVSQGLYPRMAMLLSKRDTGAAERLLARALRALLPVAAGLTLALWLFSEPIVRFALGADMEPAVPILRTLAGLPALLLVSNFFGVLVLYAHGEFAAVSRFQLVVAPISLLWLIPLIHIGGAEGAAWSALLTEAVITAGFIYLCRARGLLAWARTI